MLAVKQPVFDEKMKEETNRLELYRLIGEGYKAMEEGKISPLDEVRERLEKRRETHHG
ncbi:hypothetical protein FACS1894111_04570 [Clostridia bacterium]|nr:hypothetical protein FACS1894111_04570 [Clostridia bacterium]